MQAEATAFLDTHKLVSPRTATLLKTNAMNTAKEESHDWSDFEEESESESEEEGGDDDEARQKVYYRCAPFLAQAPAPALFHSTPHAAAVRFSQLLEFCG